MRVAASATRAVRTPRAGRRHGAGRRDVPAAPRPSRPTRQALRARRSAPDPPPDPAPPVASRRASIAAGGASSALPWRSPSPCSHSEHRRPSPAPAEVLPPLPEPARSSPNARCAPGRRLAVEHRRGTSRRGRHQSLHRQARRAQRRHHDPGRPARSVAVNGAGDTVGACTAPSARPTTRRLSIRASHAEGAAVRRRRRCPSCGHRFTTFERVDEVPLTVVKSERGCRAVRPGQGRQRAARGDEGPQHQPPSRSIRWSRRSRTPSASAGRSRRARRSVSSCSICSEQVDEVSYLRFASVYKNFDAAADFHREIELLSKLGADRG